MARETITVEMWACIDSCGDYAVGEDAEKARERYEEIIQPLSDAEGFRLVKIAVAVPLPKVAELTGAVSEDAEAELTSAA